LIVNGQEKFSPKMTLVKIRGVENRGRNKPRAFAPPGRHLTDNTELRHAERHLFESVMLECGGVRNVIPWGEQKCPLPKKSASTSKPCWPRLRS
jgi:hypothetical protein